MDGCPLVYLVYVFLFSFFFFTFKPKFLVGSHWHEVTTVIFQFAPIRLNGATDIDNTLSYF